MNRSDYHLTFAYSSLATVVTDPILKQIGRWQFDAPRVVSEKMQHGYELSLNHAIDLLYSDVFRSDLITIISNSSHSLEQRKTMAVPAETKAVVVLDSAEEDSGAGVGIGIKSPTITADDNDDDSYNIPVMAMNAAFRPANLVQLSNIELYDALLGYVKYVTVSEQVFLIGICS